MDGYFDMKAKWGMPAPIVWYKTFVFIFLFFISTTTIKAASGSYGWAYAWTRSSGSSADEFGGQDIAMDSDGNVFITGGFGSTVNFNGTGVGDDDENTANSSYNDVFITKYNANGTYGWTKTFGGSGEDYGQGVAVDSAGNVFVTGYFQSTVNFNDGGTDNHTSGGGTDIFITKYNADGTYGWTRTFGTTGDQLGYAIAVDSSDSVIAMGKFSGTVDFDATDGTDNHTSTSGNIFISKYDNDGFYSWTRTFGNSGQQWDYDITTDVDNYIYATGYFTGTADFNGSDGTDNHTSNGSDDIYITRLSTDGTYKWTVTLGDSGSDRGTGIATDANGHVLVTGFFSGTVNFDTTGGTDNHTASGGKDIFILELKENGYSLWTKSIGGTTIYDWGNSIATDENGNIFVTGGFMDEVNFDDNGGSDNHTSGPGGDLFITKYNADGSYSWTRNSVGATDQDAADAMGVIANSQNVYVTGYYTGDVDFDGTAGEDIHTSYLDTFDFYLTSYTDDTPTVTEIAADPASDSSNVSWTTNPASSTKVEYGLTQYLGSATSETDTSTRVTDHTKIVSSLKNCAKYHYRVLSADSDGNKGISTNQSFNTSGCSASSVTGGTDEYIETTGGTVELTNGQSTVTLTAPDGFYSEGAAIQVNILNSSSVPSAPSGTSLIRDNFYNLLAVTDGNSEITTFDEPISFVVDYGSGTESSYQESTFDVYKYNGSGWDEQNCTLDSTSNTLTCSLEGFSIYGIFGQQLSNPTSSPTSSPTTSSVASAPSCQDQKPTDWPNLFQINVNANQAILYYAPINGSNSNYYISFSEKSNTYEHGTLTEQGPSTGVLSYTVTDLKPKTTYYFRVRGQNGCMPGAWSNEMKITTTKGTSSGKAYYKNFLARILSIFPSKTVSVRGVNTQTDTNNDLCEYKVQSGDSLWTISASKYGTGTKYNEIMKLNNLNSDLIHPDQVLNLGCN
ncbi:hypothetical protein A2628_00005 [Candidatus Woesebacteria bacterium RIFCSPHIGHO2_01_FULL_40_22]|uniref:LysM domain-containing protein n=1 Tax=Candidatus Woesebacteria bacterium RIFCSPHIGHO2_01_FULL_40_22 TaxID=1802499 RepID=A0A1F7YGC8_9BACT|nr:MAG: hypothetical protein A2628_00005 [Candidatus Woesebacteria bacterium RIFCSPHIGHO2_01_FULL_40_22]